MMDIDIQSRASSIKPMRGSRDMGPLIPFDELVTETEVEGDIHQQEEDCSNNAPGDCTLPDPCTLLHVTNRRKVPSRKKSSLEDHELVEMQAEYEELLLKFETQRTLTDIQIDCLTRQLTDAELYPSDKYNDCSASHCYRSSNYVDKNVSLRELEAIHVIKQLQQKIKTLEMDKCSSQQNLDSVVELATEQSICAREKLEELHEELKSAREEARVTREQLALKESARIINGTFDSEIKLSMEIQDIVSEVQNSRKVVESVSSLLDEAFQSLSTIFNVFNDFKALMFESSQKQKLIIRNHETLHCHMCQKVAEVESEKLLLYNQSIELQKQTLELRHDAQNYEESLRSISKQQELEKEELLSQIHSLEKEISYLSSCSLAKEKDNLRKDLEKTKVKLKETEFKLKNIIQEKTKLEGEKAFAEKEVKRLNGQNTRLERDISKRESLAVRRRDSVVDRSSKVFDPKKSKDLAPSLELTMQEDYRKLEVLAFEMEATIASLEEEVADAHREKEEATFRNDSLTSELENLSEKLKISNAELNVLQEEVSALRQKLEESTLNQQTMESSIKMLVQEKEELAMQLTDSLLEMEEEKAIWSAKEKASIETIEEKTNLYNMDITSLSKALLEAQSELEMCREECEVLKERLTSSEENAKWEMKCSMEKSLEIDQLKDDLKRVDAQSKQSQEDEINSSKDIAKLRMRLRGTQASLDAIRYRYKEALDESDVMNREYKEATRKLKDKLAVYAKEVLNLKKQISLAKGQTSEIINPV